MRRRTMVIFCLQCLLIGMDFSLTFLTLWLYLKEVVKPAAPVLLYGIISSCFLLPSVAFAGPIGYLVDRYRNVRLAFFICNSIVILGNLLYAVPYSGCLVMGRLMAGIGGPLRSVICGEIARCYAPGELSQRLSYMGVLYQVGFVLGPTLNFAFENVDFKIRSWRITYLNMPGIYMALLFTVLQIMSVYMLSNLSQIYDLKMETVEKKMRKYIDSGGEIPENTRKGSIDTDHRTSEINEETPLVTCATADSSCTSTLKLMISNVNISLFLLLCFFASYFDNGFYVWVPLLIIEKQGWSNTALAGVIIGISISSMIPCLIITKWSVSDSAAFKVALSAPIALMVMQGVSVILFFYTQSFALSVSLLVLQSLCYIPHAFTQEIFLILTLCKMTSSRYQVFVDGVRLTMYRMGALVTLFVSPMVFSQLPKVVIVHILILVLCLLALIFCRKAFANPTIIIS